jgi:hypothetical protein
MNQISQPLGLAILVEETPLSTGSGSTLQYLQAGISIYLLNFVHLGLVTGPCSLSSLEMGCSDRMK